VYEIGSITKTFTGTLLAEMSISGVVSVDDPANKYLPKKAKLPSQNGVEITLGNLSDHTSSLPRMPSNFDPADPANPYADYGEKDLYEFISSVELTRDIGSQYEYSNLAQGLLGQILANEAKMDYEELVETVICEPLEMNETTITLDGEMQKRLAPGHSNGIVVSNWDLTSLAGAGAIRSTTHDMLIFLAANMGLKQTDLAAAMEMAQKPRHDKAGGDMVGLGWHIRPTDDGDIHWHNGGTGGYRAFTGFIKDKKYGVVLLTNSTESVDDIGIHLLDPGSPLQEINPQIATEVRKAIDEGGPDAGIARYREIKESGSDKFEINEDAMNGLGYYYMGRKNIPAALAVFKLNMEEFSESFNVYDSYAEALMEDGQDSLSIAYYKKSLELNPGNTNGIDMLAKLGVDYQPPAIKVDEAALESYVGTYELAPGFNIEITRDGQQLFGQATGQGQFELFASSETEFYLKVTPAQIHFHVGDDGYVTSLTLFQGGQEVPGIKLE
jgi:CubicO group peptidase (beta-lactamase class C family)